ncbi:major facilitator superfamily domain-containing protein [Pilobolus umbonatus]|nr:major facilitator superfamily domain-containing protein [Pilobolus umbonatus]
MPISLPRNTRLIYSYISALIVANVSGPQYVYPAFGTSLQTRFNWPALENSVVSTSCFIGASFSGPVSSWLIETRGIQQTLRISALIVFFGPFLVALTYAGRLPDHFILCTFYWICTGFGGSTAYLCALNSQSHNFKHQRGLSIGPVAAALSLCGVFYSQINDIWFNKETTKTPFDSDNTYHFLIFMSASMSIGIFMGSFFLGKITDNYQPLSSNSEQLMGDGSDRDNSYDLNVLSVEDELLYKDQEDEDQETSLSGIKFIKHPIGFSLFSTMFIVIGIGYAYIANIGHMLSSLSDNPSKHLLNFHITLFGLSNCVSRIIFSVLSDVLNNVFGVHRLWIFVLAIISLLISLYYLTVHVSAVEDLLPCTVVISSIYGMIFGVAPIVVTEFGAELFARNWGWMLFAPAMGSQAFNLLFGAFYDYQTKKQSRNTCHGTICFKNTFQICIIGSSVVLLITFFVILKLNLHKRNASTIKSNLICA